MQFFKAQRDIQTYFQSGEYALGVFIDSSKAFDSVNHDILFKKLEYCGATGIHLK